MLYSKKVSSKLLVFECCVHGHTPLPEPTLPACLMDTSALPDLTQNTGVEESQLLLNRTSNLRMFFCKTMQQRHLLHASTIKLQADMRDNMRRYKSEKAKLQEQLASLRSQLGDYHSTTSSHSPRTGWKSQAQPNRKSYQKYNNYTPRSLDQPRKVPGQRIPKPGYSNGNNGANRKASYKSSLYTERPHYLPQLDQSIINRTAQKLEWQSGENLDAGIGKRQAKLPPMSITPSETQSTNRKKSLDSRQHCKTPNTSSTDNKTDDSRQEALDALENTTPALVPNEGRASDDTIKPVISISPKLPMIPRLSLPSDMETDWSSEEDKDLEEHHGAPPFSTSRVLPRIQTDPPTIKTSQALRTENHKTIPWQKRAPGLLSVNRTPRRNNLTPRTPKAQKKQSKGSKTQRTTASLEGKANPDQTTQEAKCDPFKVPSITLRPASKTGELDRIRSFLNMETPKPTSVNQRDFKPEDPTLKWKALYLKIMDPEKRSQMLADIVFAVRAKMRENEHQLKFGETPKDLITHNTLCDFLLFKPQKATNNKTPRSKPRVIPQHTAGRSARKTTAAQLQHFLRQSIKARPMIEHLEAEEYRLARYGKHPYLLTDTDK